MERQSFLRTPRHSRGFSWDKKDEQEAIVSCSSFSFCYAIERHFRGCEYKTLTHLCFARSKLHKIKGFLPLNANIDYDKLRAKAVYCFRPLDYSQARTETAVKDAKREVYP